MKRYEVYNFLKCFFAELKNTGTSSQLKQDDSFFSLILSLKQDLPVKIPLLREIAAMAMKTSYPGGNDGLLFKKLNRLYLRLCRITEELGRLDFNKAFPGAQGALAARVAFEDFIFSQIDFSRYREINESYFRKLFLEGLIDFSGDFFTNNFGIGRSEAGKIIIESYKNKDGFYTIERDNPLILSIMRSLETSLENAVLFTPGEIGAEMKELLDFTGGRSGISLADELYSFLVLSLDDTLILHEDGMATRLFNSREKELSATFRPGNKPWTRVLIPASGETASFRP